MSIEVISKMKNAQSRWNSGKIIHTKETARNMLQDSKKWLHFKKILIQWSSTAKISDLQIHPARSSPVTREGPGSNAPLAVLLSYFNLIGIWITFIIFSKITFLGEYEMWHLYAGRVFSDFNRDISIIFPSVRAHFLFWKLQAFQEFS